MQSGLSFPRSLGLLLVFLLLSALTVHGMVTLLWPMFWEDHLDLSRIVAQKQALEVEQRQAEQFRAVLFPAQFELEEGLADAVDRVYQAAVVNDRAMFLKILGETWPEIPYVRERIVLKLLRGCLLTQRWQAHRRLLAEFRSWPGVNPQALAQAEQDVAEFLERLSIQAHPSGSDSVAPAVEASH